ncbi:MAG: hypothetical protein F4X95_01570 [Oligoflexia bacterium]|nr:hypothetical protein [Oligoflexia bacterium]
MKLNNKGSMMVLLLAMSAALTGVLILSNYKVVKYTHKNQIKRNKFTQYHLLTLSLRSIISRPDICTSALQNQKFDPDKLKSNVNIDSSIFKEEKFIQNTEGISGSKFILLNKGFTNDKLLVSSSHEFYTYKADLEVWLPQKASTLARFNYKNLNISIPLYVNIDKDNNINSCYGVYSQAAMCEKYWKAWDQSESNLDIKCNPDRQCILYGSSSTCAPPSVQIAIGGIKVSSNPSKSVMEQFVNAGRTYDTANAQLQMARDLLTRYKYTLQEMEADEVEIKRWLDRLRQILETETEAYNQAAAVLTNCQAPCANCSEEDEDDPPCPVCHCSSQAQALTTATTRVTQVQREVDTISEQYNYLVQILNQMLKMADMNGHMIKQLELVDKIGVAALKLLNSDTFLNRTKGQYLPIKADPLLKKDIELQQAFEVVEAEEKRISDTYFGGKDLNDEVDRIYETAQTGSIFDMTDEAMEARKNEAEKIFYINADISSIVTIDSYIDTITYNTYDKDGKETTFIRKGKEHIEMEYDTVDLFSSEKERPKNSTYIHSASQILVGISEIEKDIADIDNPQTPKKDTNTGPPMYLSPAWQQTVIEFKKNHLRFITQNQMLYFNFFAYSSNIQKVQKFTSSEISSVQTDMKYICIWCNKNRKEKLNEKDPNMSLF